jgi:FlaA1/EpsC-like NDP-sugar epimerase
MIKLLKKYRVPVLLCAHAVLFTLIYYSAYLVRSEFVITDERLQRFSQTVGAVVFIKIGVFFLLKNFFGWWRHVSFNDLVSLVRASLVALVTIFLADYLVILDTQIPRSIPVIDCLISIVVLGALRSGWRFWDETVLTNESRDNRQRVFIIGSDFKTAKLAHLINSNLSWKLNVVGLVTDSFTKRRYSIGQLTVVGSVDQLAQLTKEYRVKAVLANVESLTAKRLREIIDQARNEDYKIRVIPNFEDQLNGDHKIPVREVSVEDLLRRPPTQLDQSAIAELVKDKRILITGAGGSIGSELCRQLAKFEPAELVLLGRGENRIFHIERELRRDFPNLRIQPWIGSITDEKRMEQLFRQCKPHLVYHAAAHKHVPLTEFNVGEAVLNNVYGTRVIADKAVEHNVEEFVLVSSDKAVNPTSVMGCTKQMGERYCLALGNRNPGTKFIVTRFGNVLGSAGSVIPVFAEQIRSGGPITITDKRMTRFFMTIPEAAQLVVQSSAMGNGGEIFVLDMGSQINIEDMARDMIRLAGLGPDDIEIVYTGIRKGEKLYEELYYQDEEAMKTSHNKILTAYHRNFDYEEVQHSVEHLLSLAYGPEAELRQGLQEIIPEYQQVLQADDEVAESEIAGR